jgi:hypothetical protein
MHGPINVKSPNNISKWQMGFNLAFKGLIDKFVTEFTSVVYLFIFCLKSVFKSENML